MFEKVNAGHPDKMADRLAGAVVDLVYERAGGADESEPPRSLRGDGGARQGGRTDRDEPWPTGLAADDLDPLIHRLFGERVEGNVLIAPQDPHLSDNQTHGLRCGDNGIFKGCPPTEEQRVLTAIAATIYGSIPYDGKYIIEQRDGQWDLTVCQSHLSLRTGTRTSADAEGGLQRTPAHHQPPRPVDGRHQRRLWLHE